MVSLEEPELRLEHCIEFVVRGNPPPTLRWLHNGQPLRESRIIRVEYYQEGEVAEGCLLFNKPTHYNNGNYTLIARNPLGTANQTINGHFLKEPFPGAHARPSGQRRGRGTASSRAPPFSPRSGLWPPAVQKRRGTLRTWNRALVLCPGPRRRTTGPQPGHSALVTGLSRRDSCTESSFPRR